MIEHVEQAVSLIRGNQNQAMENVERAAIEHVSSWSRGVTSKSR
jgi:hypothetical protein